MVAPMCALACGDSTTSSSSLSASASATNPATEAMTLSGIVSDDSLDHLIGTATSPEVPSAGQQSSGQDEAAPEVMP